MALKERIKATLTPRNVVAWLGVVLGVVVMSAGFVLFTNPYKIIPGGVYGLGRVLHHIFPAIPTGTFGFMFDIPLMISGFLIFGSSFGAKTIFAALLTPVVMNNLTDWIGENPADGVSLLSTMFNFSDNLLMAAIFGGLLIGAGTGIIIRSGATSGGTDIVSMILSRYLRVKFSSAMFGVESCIVLVGMIVFADYTLPLYSLIAIFVSAKALDFVLDGASYEKLLFVISDHREEIKHFILHEMGRGGTWIHSSGMYTDKEREMVFLVVSRKEIAQVKHKIHTIDKDAFVVVVDAYETYGDGFKQFDPETEKNTNNA
ncbi:MAG: YitT family protein [Tidjanibacter sp.]|nr:YitT family protein [Tidjanibacter sp.]